MEGLAQVVRRVSIGVRSVANGDTEDVVQEALARAIKSGVSLEAEQWLRTVAKRVAIDVHRRKHEIPVGGPTDIERSLPSTEGDPEDIFIRAERSRAVREAMATLPPRYQKALLAYAEEDSPAAVATRLGLSASATWTLLSRARSRLRLQLEQVGFVPALVSMTRARWRGLAAGAAAAGVAATVAFVPHAGVPVVKPVKPVIVSMSAPRMSVGHVVAHRSLLPVAPTAVAAKVTKTVNDQVKAVPAALTLSTCGAGLLKQPVSVQVTLTHDPANPNALARLVGRLPEQLRAVGPQTCAPKLPVPAILP